MGLTRQERQDRLWNEAVALRDKADKERAFKALLEACREAKDLLNQLYREGHLNTDKVEQKLTKAIQKAEAL